MSHQRGNSRPCNSALQFCVRIVFRLEGLRSALFRLQGLAPGRSAKNIEAVEDAIVAGIRRENQAYSSMAVGGGELGIENALPLQTGMALKQGGFRLI